MQSSLLIWNKNKLILLILFLLLFLSPLKGQVNHHYIFKPVADSLKINQKIIDMLKVIPNHLPGNLNQPLKLKLRADRNFVHTGEPVKLKAELNINTEKAVYKFYDPDGKLILSGGINQCTYRFPESGAYLLSVVCEIRPGDDVAVAANTLKLMDSLQVQVDSVALYVKPIAAETGNPVSFTTEFQNEQGIVYRFMYGDASNPELSDKPETEHSYPQPGSYFAHAEIGRMRGEKFEEITRSITKQVTILNPIQPPDNTENIFVELTADRTEVNTGRVITFAAATNAEKDGLQYMFNFGDGAYSKTFNSSVEHIFKNPGEYIVSVRLILNDEFIDNADDSLTVFINPSLREFVTLKSNKLNASTGEPIKFIAETNSMRRGLEFVFNTGIPDQALNSPRNIINYTYRNRGNYNAFVQIALKGEVLATSEILNISITEPAGFPWWIFIAGLLVLTAVTYGVKKIFPHSKISFHPHTGQGKIEIENPGEFSINYEIDFVPGTDSAKLTLSNDLKAEIKK